MSNQKHTDYKQAFEGSTLPFKPRADITRSPKQGYHWPHQKNLFPVNFFKKIIKANMVITLFVVL